MDVTDFLLARVAEDEAVAKAAADTWDYYVNYDYGVDREHGERWSPAVVLAECEAKRGIVELHELIRAAYPGTTIESDPCCEVCSAGGEYPGGYPCRTLRFLASPYATHPDYKSEWSLAACVY